jgi:branched-chain amino acid transport system ATP-binding protein
MSLIQVSDLNVFYGQFQALFGVSLAVDEGEAVAIIGANGAGKSTLMKAIAGLVFPGSGGIHFDGVALGNRPANKRVADGISLVPEGRRIFPSLTVDENLTVGAYLGRTGPWSKPRIYETFPLLQRLATRSAAKLSGGEQQALSIGRALMANPRVLLLDEVSLGLAPIVVRQVYEAIPAIRAEGTTIMLVEQDVNQALSVADRVYCLLEGRVSLSGTPSSLNRADITRAYFGAVEHNVGSSPAQNTNVAPELDPVHP